MVLLCWDGSKVATKSVLLCSVSLLAIVAPLLAGVLRLSDVCFAVVSQRARVVDWRVKKPSLLPTRFVRGCHKLPFLSLC